MERDGKNAVLSNAHCGLERIVVGGVNAFLTSFRDSLRVVSGYHELFGPQLPENVNVSEVNELRRCHVEIAVQLNYENQGNYGDVEHGQPRAAPQPASSRLCERSDAPQGGGFRVILRLSQGHDDTFWSLLRAGIVDGSLKQPDLSADPQGCKWCQDMDASVQYSILQNVSNEDHKFINSAASGCKVWKALNACKRNYAYSIGIFSGLARNEFHRGGDIELWIEKMECLRNELEELGDGMSDVFYAYTLQACVVETHADVLEAFYDRFALTGREHPSSREVIQALRSVLAEQR